MTVMADPVIKQMRFLMNTLVRIEVWDAPEARAQEAINRSFEEIKRLEDIFSRFRPESDISRINQSAGRPEPVRVSPETIEVLQEAVRLSRLTNGAFDPTVTPLMNLWNSGRAPSADELKQVLNLVNYQAIEIDALNRTVRLPNQGMALDLGGIAKGYTLDRVAALLKSAGIKNGLINMGGNILALGNAEAGIQDPLNQDGIIGSIVLKDEAISTSASYERFFTINGQRFSHIINPKDGQPVKNEVLSVSVISRSAILGDALSTAFFVMGHRAGMGLISRLPEVSAVIIYQDEPGAGELKIAYSKDYKDRLTLCGYE